MSIFDRLAVDPVPSEPRQAGVKTSIFDRVAAKSGEPVNIPPVDTLAPGAGNVATRSLYEQARGTFQAVDDAVNTVANFGLYGASKVADLAGVTDSRFSGKTLRGAMLEQGTTPSQSVVGAALRATGSPDPYNSRGELKGTAEATSSVYTPEAISNMLGRQVPQVALSSNPVVAAGFATLSQGNNLNDYYENAKKRGLTEDEAIEAAVAGQSASLAGQALLERFSPVNRLVKKLGVKEPGDLLGRVATATFKEANTELAQQFLDESIKLGLLPPEARTKEAYQGAVKSLLDSFVLGGLSGGVFQGAVEVPNAAINRDVRPTSTDEGVATADDIRRAEAGLEPPAPPALSRLNPVNRTTGVPLNFESAYDKAKYISENPAFRGPNKARALEYVTAIDNYRNNNGISAPPIQGVGTSSPIVDKVSRDTGSASLIERVAQADSDANPATLPGTDVAVSSGTRLQNTDTISELQSPSRVGQLEGRPGGQLDSVQSDETPQLAPRPADAVKSVIDAYPELEFNLRPRDGQQARLKRSLASKGISVNYYTGKTAGRGFVTKATPGVIFIHRDNLTKPKELRKVLLHELGHELEFNQPDLWKQIQSTIQQVDRDFADSRLARGAVPANATPDYIRSERGVIPLERIANDPRIIRALEGQDASILTRIRAALKTFIARLRGTSDPLLNSTIEAIEALPFNNPAAPDRGGVQSQGYVEQGIPPTDYGYWYFPGQGFRVVAYQDHENVARDAGFKDTADAVERGAVRVTTRA
jgi:hypothetical protein